MKKYGLSNLKYQEDLRDFRQLTKTAEEKPNMSPQKSTEGTKKSYKQLFLKNDNQSLKKQKSQYVKVVNRKIYYGFEIRISRKSCYNNCI